MTRPRSSKNAPPPRPSHLTTPARRIPAQAGRSEGGAEASPRTLAVQNTATLSRSKAQGTVGSRDYERLARVLAAALAAWWRGTYTYPSDSDVER